MDVISKLEEKRSINQVEYNRGMTIDEVEKLLTTPMPNRERAFFSAIYDTFYRVNELLQCNIEDYNRQTGELIAKHTKTKYNPKTKQHFKSLPKHMIVSKSTQILLRKIIGNRKKGAIFVNKKGERLSKTYFQVCINEIATSIGIQKITHITKTSKNYHLVTLKALREAGERHCDLAGADLDITARGAQHSAIVKEKYYKKAGWEEVQDQIRKHHPTFKEGDYGKNERGE